MPIAEKFFTPQQVELHNSPDDCWVSFLGLVYNLTPLIEHNQQANPQLLRPILLNAGTDISHWFTPDGKVIAIYAAKAAAIPILRINDCIPAIRPIAACASTSPACGLAVICVKDRPMVR